MRRRGGSAYAGEPLREVQGEKTKGNWAREGSLPRREGPGRRRGGRAAGLGQIHGSTAAWRRSAFVVRALQCSSGSCASRVNAGWMADRE